MSTERVAASTAGVDAAGRQAPSADDPAYRLGHVLASLKVARDALVTARKHASPSGPLKQPLEPEVEHEGHWLTRKQVYDVTGMVSDLTVLTERVEARMDPRCKGTLGDRPGWMSPDQFDPCRCLLPRNHDGDHECEHTHEAAAAASGRMCADTDCPDQDVPHAPHPAASGSEEDDHAD